MPITAKFDADFEQFKGATAAATTTLNSFEGSAGKAGSALRLVASNSEAATPHVNSLRGAMSSFDGVLAAAGVHMGPEIRALGELGDASGKSASQVGVLGTAGLVFGAAIGGWKIGRLVSDFFDLDSKIGNATAKLLGWGDVAGQVAGARADVLALASTRAGRSITDLSDAMRINLDWVTQHTTASKASEKAYAAWREAMVEVNSAGVTWQATLDTIDGNTVDNIRVALAAGVSQQALAKEYFLTDVQVKSVATSMAFEADVLKNLQASKEAVWKADDARRAIEKEGDEIKKARTKEVNQTVIDGFTLIKAEAQRLADFEDQTWMNATDFQVKKAWEAADEKIKSFKGTEQQRAAYASATLQATSAEADAIYAKDVEFAAKTIALLKQVTRTVQEEAAVTAAIIAGEVSNVDYLKLLGDRQAQGKTPAGFSIGAPAGSVPASSLYVNPFIPHAAGGPVNEGPAYLHDNEYVVPSGGALVMRGGERGFTWTGDLIVQGNVTSERDLVRVVSDTITKQILSGAKVGA